MSKIIKIIILILLVLNGVLFISNIYVLGDSEAAIKMHEDLAPSATALIANTKVIVSFVSGILYIVTAIGIIRKRYSLALWGIIAFVLFDGLYVIELIMWGKTHPMVWFGFSIFGGLSFLFAAYSWWCWRTKCQI